jgi:predicted SPOUT superfamily RNA methylase MTH1
LSERKLSIAIPASVVSDTPHLREKTAKIGLIGRAAAIFRVNKIIIYPDTPKTNQTRDSALVATLLAYMETPQYLRKRLFKLQPELQYAGVLPPLRTAHHPLNSITRNLKVGEFREGVTLSRTSEDTLVDIGVEQPALASSKQLPMNRRMTFKVSNVSKRAEVEEADRDKIPYYWGYTVLVEKHSFGEIVRSGAFDMTVATSKYGTAFADAAEKIREKWANAEKILVAFGAPNRGLKEIARFEGLSLEEIVDFVVNTIPVQGTETVRTEEALIASLAILNVHLRV